MREYWSGMQRVAGGNTRTYVLLLGLVFIYLLSANLSLGRVIVFITLRSNAIHPDWPTRGLRCGV